eukprot:7670237-Pyramimonas_sp.AAC.1
MPRSSWPGRRHSTPLAVVHERAVVGDQPASSSIAMSAAMGPHTARHLRLGPALHQLGQDAGPRALDATAELRGPPPEVDPFAQELAPELQAMFLVAVEGGEDAREAPPRPLARCR